MNRNLTNITAADLRNAKQREQKGFEVCPPGVHTARVIEFVEEETYNSVKLEINGKQYNFFYNYFLRNSQDFDADVLNWIISLSTIPVTDTTSLMEIGNSAIGSSYKIEVYNYTSKSGKNAGKVQHGIQFSTKPELVTVEIEEEEYNLPY
jgi:hypothetical protein